MREERIGFIGFGNMAGAIARGLLSAGSVRTEQLYACAGHYERLEERCRAMGGIHACRSIEELISETDTAFLAVKPAVLPTLLPEIRGLLSGKTLISVVWGWDHARLRELLPEDTRLLCTCPNTPVSVGKGIFVVEEKHSLPDTEYERVKALLSSIGLFVPVDSARLGIAGAISGCGPAFAAMFTEALADAGVLYGLPRETAYLMASGMLEGTAALQRISGEHPAAMKDAVCSPGGATIRGVAALEEKGFRAAVISAVRAIGS